MYRGTFTHLTLCRSVFAAVLDIVPSMHVCGPACVSWQLPAERTIEELGPLIHSHSCPGTNITASLMRQTQAELFTALGQKYAAMQWSDATGQASQGEGPPRGSVVECMGRGETVTLLPPRSAVAHLAEAELACMREALAVPRVAVVAAAILSMKVFGLKLVDGKFAESRPAGSDCTKHRHRKFLLRNNSTKKRRRSYGQEAGMLVTTYAAALHYAVVFVAGEPMAFAYLARIKFARDRRGRYDDPAQRFGNDCLFSAGGVRDYAKAALLDAVVGSLEREGVLFVFYARERSHQSHTLSCHTTTRWDAVLAHTPTSQSTPSRCCLLSRSCSLS